MIYEPIDVIALRPHHGLCLQFFAGRGYSELFVERMTWIQQQLEKNPLIELVSGADALCDACPNTLGECCSHEETFSRYDEALLRITSLQIGRKIRWEDLKERIQKRVFDQGRFHEICSDCEWEAFCH